MRPWGSTTYIHIHFHKYGKLGLRGRFESKEYVFIGEHDDGTITELESEDDTFLEDDFPRIGEIDRDLHLYEMMDHDIRSTPKQKLMFEPSGSELVPITSTVKKSILRKSSRQIIPR